MDSINRSVLSTSAFLIVVLAGVSSAKDILVPFLLAMFIAIICSPLVNVLEEIKLPRSLAVLLSIVIILIAGSAIGQMIGSSITIFTANLPSYKAQLTTHLSAMPDFISIPILNQPVSDLIANLEPGQAMNIGVNLLSNVSDILSNTFLILLAAVFLLMETESFASKIRYFSSTGEKYHENIESFISSVKNYMLIKTWISILTGSLISFSLWLIGVEHYMLWGFLAFLLNYVPSVGSLIAAVPAVCLTFIQLGSGTALLVIGLYIAINVIIGNIVEPRFMGNGLDLSTTVIFVSLVFWGWLLGPISMLLCIPLTMVVKIACENSERWGWLSILLSESAPGYQNTSPNIDGNE